MSLPSRKKWVELKTKHHISDGAVRGVSLGPLVEKVFKATTPAAEIPALKEFLKAAATYIAKIDKKKVTNYPAFEKAFLDDYMDEARKTLRNYELAADTRALMASELARFFKFAQGFTPATADAKEVTAFVHKGRSVSSAILRAPDIADYTKMKAILTELDGVTATLTKPENVPGAATKAFKLAKALAAEAKAQKLVK